MADLCTAVVDFVERQHQLVGMMLGTATELAAVVGEDGLDRDADGFVEGQDPAVEQVGSRGRHLFSPRGVNLGEGQRAEGVDNDLGVDLPNSHNNDVKIMIKTGTN